MSLSYPNGSEILEHPSFPFPSSTTTPLSSLVFLTDAIYDQCTSTQGQVQVKDIIGLIRNDPNQSVSTALGVPSQGIESLFLQQQNDDANTTRGTTITKQGLLALFEATRVSNSSSIRSSTPGVTGTSALNAGSSSLLQLPPIGTTTAATTAVGNEDPSPDNSPRTVGNQLLLLVNRAQVRGVPFPNLPPDNMTLPPKAPKHPLPRSPKRKKFTVGVEGGHVRADARGRYAEVLRVDPNNTDALEHIGFFYVNDNQPTKALQALNRARALGCDNLRLWRSTGKAHYLKWRLKWSKLETPLGSTLVPLKSILLHMPDDEHLQAAHLAYERCTKFHLFVPDSKFWHELAEVYFHFKAYEGAFGVVRHITRDDPKYVHLSHVVVMCGVMYFRLKQYAKSIACWERVLHDPPFQFKERNVLFILGRLHMLNNNVEKSTTCFEEVYDFVRKRNLQVSEEQASRVQSARDYVQDPDTWYDEANKYMDNGYYEMAHDAFQMALKYSIDIDAKLGVPDYSREHLKNIWVGIGRTWAFRNDSTKTLDALVEAQAARPYDYYVRAGLTQIDPDSDKWAGVFVMESKHALMLTRLVRGHLERQRVRREKRIMGNAATKMARIFRGVRWRIRLKGLYLTLIDRRRNVRTRRSRALVKMQSIGRMLRVRNQYFRTKMAALKISSGIRGLLGRTKALRRRNEVMEAIRRRNNRAATRIQCAARGFALRTQLNRNWAAIDIQALARGYIQRRRIYFTVKEPQLIETSRSGYPRGTPGHRRHWQRRLEQCEFLYSDRMELRREIGVLTARHPCITPHEAFLALAETTGDLDYASKLLIRDTSFAEELYEMAQAIDVDQYIALRPAPIVGPVAAARRKRTLSRRWMAALSDPIDNRSTAIRVEEMARTEDPGHLDFLDRRVQYTTAKNVLPWHVETVAPKEGVKRKHKVGSGSTRERRGILHSIQKSLTPERTRSFGMGGRSGGGGGAGGHDRYGDRLFAPVSLTQNIFQNTIMDHNLSALPVSEEVSNIKKRLRDLGTNMNQSVSSIVGTAKYIDETVSIRDQANSRRSTLRKQIKRGRPGDQTTMKSLGKIKGRRTSLLKLKQ